MRTLFLVLAVAMGSVNAFDISKYEKLNNYAKKRVEKIAKKCLGEEAEIVEVRNEEGLKYAVVTSEEAEIKVQWGFWGRVVEEDRDKCMSEDSEEESEEEETEEESEESQEEA